MSYEIDLIDAEFLGVGDQVDRSPELNLWLAVIEQAVREATRAQDGKLDEERRAARRWFKTADAVEVFRYAGILGSLGKVRRVIAEKEDVLRPLKGARKKRERKRRREDV